jgi:splicing factor 3B subunit 3
MRFLGARVPILLPVSAAGLPAMMALSTLPWLGHVHHGKFQIVPLAYDALDYVAPFCSEKVPEGLVAVCRNNKGTGTLRVLTIDRLGEPFTHKSVKLSYTPRKLLVDAEHGLLITIESDRGVEPLHHRADLKVWCEQNAGCLSPHISHLQHRSMIVAARLGFTSANF